MSALGALFIFTLVLFFVMGIAIAALLLIKNPKVHNVMFVFVSLLTMWVSFLGATSAPSNYIWTQIIAWLWGLLAIVAIVMHFFSNKFARYATYLLAFVAAASVIDLLFV